LFSCAGKLIVCYDDNHITIDGDTKLSFTEGKTAHLLAAVAPV
jgi:transketolase